MTMFLFIFFATLIIFGLILKDIHSLKLIDSIVLFLSSALISCVFYMLLGAIIFTFSNSTYIDKNKIYIEEITKIDKKYEKIFPQKIFWNKDYIEKK